VPHRACNHRIRRPEKRQENGCTHLLPFRPQVPLPSASMGIRHPTNNRHHPWLKRADHTVLDGSRWRHYRNWQRFCPKNIRGFQNFRVPPSRNWEQVSLFRRCCVPVPHGPLSCQDNDPWTLVIGCLLSPHPPTSPRVDKQHGMRHDTSRLVLRRSTLRPSLARRSPDSQASPSVLQWPRQHRDDSKVLHASLRQFQWRSPSQDRGNPSPVSVSPKTTLHKLF
jgi:hypothetical protein